MTRFFAPSLLVAVAAIYYSVEPSRPVIFVLVTSLLAFVLYATKETPNKGVNGGYKLGDPVYEFPPVDAPAASGRCLLFLTKILTNSPIGYHIRRYLLTKNRTHRLRELAAQTGPSNTPLYYPMHRVSAAEHKRHESMRGKDDLPSILQKGFPNLVSPTSNFCRTTGIYFLTYFNVLFLPCIDKHRHCACPVEDYARAYRDKGGTTPSVEMERWIAKATSGELAKLNIWSSLLPDNIRAQAKASDERFRRGQPLSVFDGVPVAVKEMIRVSGHGIHAGLDASNFNLAPGGAPSFGSACPSDDPIVARFRELGAIIVGTTVMTEGGVSPLGWSAHWQGPFNPYNLEHYSGQNFHNAS